jgi:predicted DCC family thiol-disulfide oxidoreductase YuxK
MNDKMIILFDGVCNLCLSSIQFIIKNDLNDKFRLAAIQSKEGKKIIRKYSIDIIKNDSIILINNKNINYRSTAVLLILKQLVTFWRIFYIFYFIPYPIRDFFYFLVAKSRYNFFGKKIKCMIPDEKIKSKFLNLKSKTSNHE